MGGGRNPNDKGRAGTIANEGGRDTRMGRNKGGFGISFVVLSGWAVGEVGHVSLFVYISVGLNV